MIFLIFILSNMIASCKDTVYHLEQKNDSLQMPDSLADTISVLKNITDTIQPVLPPSQNINTKNTKPEEILNFAYTLIGTPYKYASSNPAEGFDCSGFITYVFNHFNIAVPRSSVDFTIVGTTVEMKAAKPGDLILFTGTNPEIRIVGHMGIVKDNTDTLRFIHSSSGKANGVVVSPLSRHYQERFVKVIRIFPQNF